METNWPQASTQFRSTSCQPYQGSVGIFFTKMANFRSLFLYFRRFNTVDSKQINVRFKSLPMTGFEPRTSCIVSDRSIN